MIVSCGIQSLHVSQSTSRIRVDKLYSHGPNPDSHLFCMVCELKMGFKLKKKKLVNRIKGKQENYVIFKFNVHKYDLTGILLHSFIYLLSKTAFEIKFELRSSNRD